MITYKCEHGHVFFENEMVRDRVMEGEYPRDRYICPDCGTEEFEEAHVCEGCGEWCKEDELYLRLCKKCREEDDKGLDAYLRTLTGPHREYIRDREEREGGLIE